MRRFFSGLAVGLGLFLAITNPGYAGWLSNLMKSLKPPVRPPAIKAPNVAPPKLGPAVAIPGSRSPFALPGNRPHIHFPAVVPEISKGALDDISSLAKSKPLEALHLLEREKHLLTPEHLRLSESKVASGFVDSAARTAGKGQWKEAGDIYLSASSLTSKPAGLKVLVNFHKIEKHTESLNLALAGKPAFNGIEHCIPRELVLANRGLAGANEISTLLSGTWRGPPNVTTIKSNLKSIGEATKNQALTDRLRCDLAAQAYLRGHPVEAHQILNAGKLGVDEAKVCNQLLRDMQTMVLGDGGRVATGPARQILSQMGDGVAAARAPPAGVRALLPEGNLTSYRPPVADSIAADLPLLGNELAKSQAVLLETTVRLVGREQALLAKAKPHILLLAARHLRTEWPIETEKPVWGFQPNNPPEKSQPERTFQNEVELVQFLESRLVSLSPLQRDRALRLNDQGWPALSILFDIETQVSTIGTNPGFWSWLEKIGNR